MGNGLQVRSMTREDDVLAVAKLIYKTDPYIYPYMFDDEKQGVNVIAKMIEGNTLYNYRNITLALLDGNVVGITVALKPPIKIDMTGLISAYLDAGVTIDGRFSRVYNEYFKPMEEETEGIYIANVCVSEQYRGRGIAKEMLAEILLDNEIYHLETVKANLSALKLYQGLGFEIIREYKGFVDVPCYKMKKCR